MTAYHEPRHAETQRKITEIPKQGLKKGICVCQSASGVCDRKGMLTGCMMTISGMLTAAELCRHELMGFKLEAVHTDGNTRYGANANKS